MIFSNDIFIISLNNFFVIKGASFARRYFCLLGARLSNLLYIFFLEITDVKLIKGEIVNIITEFCIVKFVVIAICYNFW